MTNQSPAEAQEELEKLLDFIIDRVSYMINQRVAGDWREQTKKPIRSRVTAYAATVEREAVEDTIWKIMSPKTEGLFDGGDLFIKRKPIEDAIIGMIGYEKYKALQEAVDTRLAALQGPIQGDSK